MSLPLDEGNQLLEEVIREVKKRKPQPSARKRLLLWGSILDSDDLLEMVEKLDADLVMDDICTGSRFFWPDVEVTDDPLDGLAKRYLVDLKCPRTFRQQQGGYQASLENRFGYLKDFAEEWRADGALLQSLRYCDIHGYEVPAVKDYFQSIGLPSIFIEYGYNKSGMAQLKTRVQAFLETLDGR
jgi:benzoyl-CoA reductase/2-hydroxyglutaryl-CoA dehydratase subunit BcrC/BadD/HgdB